MGAVKKIQAKVASLAGTMVAGSFWPSGPLAKKLFAFNVAGSTGLEKKTWDRTVTPTSDAPAAGVAVLTMKGCSIPRGRATELRGQARSQTEFGNESAVVAEGEGAGAVGGGERADVAEGERIPDDRGVRANCW